jgi:D-alanyl-D-alanine carboxypeptidase/D-alanyl-D-alanine-endopeptidase (penicillin-binding protein 4)
MFKQPGFQLLILNYSLLILSGCSITHKISRAAQNDVINNQALTAAHVGISIFEPATNKYWFNYQGDKYFVPASNTKLPTCYAAMKYLGDSLVSAFLLEKDTAVFILPNADPTLLYPGYPNQPLIAKLQNAKKNIYLVNGGWEETPLGSGWAWNDYEEYYMAERSVIPVYGNIIKWVQEIDDPAKPAIVYSIPEINWDVNFVDTKASKNFTVNRALAENSFTLITGTEKKKEQEVPFVTKGVRSAIELLKDTIHRDVRLLTTGMNRNNFKAIHSQPTDSMLKPMMHRSDNFFAEQSLLMVGNARLGVMNDEKIIDTLLKTDFKDLPQKPRWVDGCGLSRYNLFTPQDFVVILNKMKNEFGMDRIKVILATGGEGTISSYYKADAGFIYGKTGTLSGVVAFSGFLYTKKGKLLIFSTLVNNHQGSATEVRRAVEKFLEEVRGKY